jgi:uncharacterized membrane protein
MNSDLMTVLIQYLKQPSTWQGITLLAGSLATWLGVPVEMVTSAGVLLLAVILIVKDERPTKDVVQDALGKVLEDKVDKP